MWLHFLTVKFKQNKIKGKNSLVLNSPVSNSSRQQAHNSKETPVSNIPLPDWSSIRYPQLSSVHSLPVSVL